MKKNVRDGKLTEKTPMSKATHSEKQRLLKKMAQAVEDARNRVSGYSSEERERLETFARGLIKGVNSKQVCGTR
jgi:hypothetical protein